MAVTAYTGTVGQITLSGSVLTGLEKQIIEASLEIGKERGKHNPIGTEVSTHTSGMRTVTGTLRRAWISGDALFQTLMDLADGSEFTCVVAVSGQTSITASGCIATNVTRRVAPGTEVITEELAIVGRNWY